MGGLPIVLAEQHPWLHAMMTGVLRDAQQFWAKMDSLPTWRGSVPKSALRALQRMQPRKDLQTRIVHRIAGLGSLGRERFVGISMFEGGKIAREAKALAPSACVWAAGQGSERILYQQILNRALRAVDPFVRLKGRWMVRRLAPDCSRVELTSMPKERDESKLLHAMGFETANVHLGTPAAIKALVRDLERRPAHWLHIAASNMVKATTQDWRDWRASLGL